VTSNYSSPDPSADAGLDGSDGSDPHCNLDVRNGDGFNMDDGLDDEDEELHCESLENAGMTSTLSVLTSRLALARQRISASKGFGCRVSICPV